MEYAIDAMEEHCLSAAKRCRDHARFLMRSARRDPIPPHWGVEHRDIVEARFHYEQARRWVREARVARAKASYARDMREFGVIQ